MKEDAKLVFGIGKIVISVYRTREEARDGWTATNLPLNDTPIEIAEKALKGRALSHGVGWAAFSLTHYCKSLAL